MPRSRHRDHPDYAVAVIDGAKPIGSQLSVAAGILAILLVAMSAVAQPMQPPGVVDGRPEATGSTEPSVAGPLCLISVKIKDWIAVTAS